MQRLREQLVWIGGGVACYLAAALVFLWIALRSGILGTTRTSWSLSAAEGIGLLLSVVLFVIGGYAMRRGRRAAMTRPEKSALPPQYRSDPRPDESNASTSRPSADEIATEANAGNPDTIRCPDCGARNDPAFTFCQQCSTNLSE